MLGIKGKVQEGVLNRAKEEIGERRILKSFSVIIAFLVLFEIRHCL